MSRSHGRSVVRWSLERVLYCLSHTPIGYSLLLSASPSPTSSAAPGACHPQTIAFARARPSRRLCRRRQPGASTCLWMASLGLLLVSQKGRMRAQAHDSVEAIHASTSASTTIISEGSNGSGQVKSRAPRGWMESRHVRAAKVAAGQVVLVLIAVRGYTKSSCAFLASSADGCSSGLLAQRALPPRGCRRLPQIQHRAKAPSQHLAETLTLTHFFARH